MAKMPDITTFSVHYNILPKTPFSKNTMSRGKVTFPVRGKFTFPFTSFQALVQLHFPSLIFLPLPPATPNPLPVPDLGILVDTPWESS